MIHRLSRLSLLSLFIFLMGTSFVFANVGVQCLTGYREQCDEENGCKEEWSEGCEYCEDIDPVEYSCNHEVGGGSTDCGEIFESCVILEPPEPSDCPNVGSGSFTGCYRDLESYASSPLIRTGEVIDFDFDVNPVPLLDSDYFSAKWEGDFNFPTTGTYRFNALVDDGIRIYVDGVKILNEWYDQGAWETHKSEIGLLAGTHRVKVEYYERSGDASAQVWWEYMTSEIAPSRPTITGPTTGSPNTNYTYTFTGTDIEGDNIRYGIDWNMDEDEDDWLPFASHTTSGNTLSIVRSWGSVGEYIFQALTKDEGGTRSGWEVYYVDISSTPTDGVCGTANGKVYPSSATGYSPDVQCAVGTSSDTGFPSVGTTKNWTCLGSGVGGADASCGASRSDLTFVLTLTANPGPGGYIISEDGYVNTEYCASPCLVNFAAGSLPVTLRAVPESSYWKFDNWTGACSGSGQCTVSVNSNISVGATFTPRLFLYKEL